MREICWLDEEVMALAPVAEAPKSRLMEAISLSAWINSPPEAGRCLERYSGISFWGVMGYPKKRRHPASMAPMAIASFPLTSILSEVVLLTLPPYTNGHIRTNLSADGATRACFILIPPHQKNSPP